jgi:hypothetical protein
MFKETIAEYSIAHPNSIEISDPKSSGQLGLKCSKSCGSNDESLLAALASLNNEFCPLDSMRPLELPQVTFREIVASQ